MSMSTVLQQYFVGEKTEALVFILPLGVLSLVFGAWLLSERAGGFLRGVAIPFLLMGLLMTVVGAVVGYRTPAQVEALERGLESSPEATVTAEQQRMDAVNRAWPVYAALWGVFGVVGLALRFGTRHDMAQGIGIALVFFAGVGLLVDGFAERRARPYTVALHGDTMRHVEGYD